MGIPPQGDQGEGDDQVRGQHVEAGGGGPVADLRSADERDLVAGERLLDGLQDAGQVHRQQHQVEAVDPEDVGEAVAAVAQVDPMHRK